MTASFYLRYPGLSAPTLVPLFGLSTPAFAQYRFVPTGGDDSAAIQQILREHRRVQIAGSEIRLDSTIQLEDEHGAPLHGVVVEPAPGIPFVTVRTTITKNPAEPTDPSRAVFNYNGGFHPGSFLLEDSASGTDTVQVRSPSLLNGGTAFLPGQAVCLNASASVPSLDWPVAVLPSDGAMEVFRILAVASHSPSVVTLTLDRAMTRDHAARASVVHCAPLQRPTFRYLSFESIDDAEPRAAIHLHTAQHAELVGIRSRAWRGFTLILLDSGGRNNVIRDSFAEGVTTGWDGPNGWGIAVEGQEGTLIVNSGASRFAEGIVINYSIDTWAYGVYVDMTTVIALDLSPDHQGHPSIRSGFVGGRIVGGGIGAYLGTGCVDCRVEVDMHQPYAGVVVGPWTARPTVKGRILEPAAFGLALTLLFGGIGDGASTAVSPLLDAQVTCHPNRMALIRGPYVVGKAPSSSAGYYELGPNMAACLTGGGTGVIAP